MTDRDKDIIAAKQEKFDAKQDARDSRLSLRKTNEEVIRITLRNEASEKCKEYLNAMGKCAQENGLMVVFKCRAQNKAMSDCMDLHYNENIVEEHLLKRGYLIKKK